MIERITIGARPHSGDNSESCCGGSTCAPGPAATGGSGATEDITTADSAAVDTAIADIATAYAVEGMTCGHCVSAVRDELLQLPGVLGVDVDLDAGGISTVTVTARQAPAESAVRDAIDEAGYRLLGTGSSS